LYERKGIWAFSVLKQAGEEYQEGSQLTQIHSKMANKIWCVLFVAML